MPNKNYIEDSQSLIEYTNNNKKEIKLVPNPSEFTFNNKSSNNNMNNNNNNINNNKIINGGNTEINDIDRTNSNNKREGKYKNLENPFSISISPKMNDKEERKKKIMDRINRGRKHNSQIIEKDKYNKSDNIQKIADNLEKHLFKEE